MLVKHIPTKELRAQMSARRILVVDDEEPICDFLHDVLADEGYAVRTAANGRAALALIQDQIPDLILTDLMMPGMDGQALCTHLRATPSTAHIPIVLMTAANKPPITAPFTAIITKPFSLVTLLQQIGHALES